MRGLLPVKFGVFFRGEGDLKNFAHLWKYPGYAPACLRQKEMRKFVVRFLRFPTAIQVVQPIDNYW